MTTTDKKSLTKLRGKCDSIKVSHQRQGMKIGLGQMQGSPTKPLPAKDADWELSKQITSLRKQITSLTKQIASVPSGFRVCAAAANTNCRKKIDSSSFKSSQYSLKSAQKVQKHLPHNVASR